MELTGVLPVCKPPGPTSHDVVAAVRRALRTAHAGHAGTLDPAAGGVLPVCIGAATRLQRFLHLPPKGYRFVLALGATTDTGDQTGVPQTVADGTHLREDDLRRVLPNWVGPLRQQVPQYSARRVGGRRAYDLARSGEFVPAAWADARVYALRMLAWCGGRSPRALCEVVCSGGTYVRALCADIGAALGVGGHMAALVRTRAGGFDGGDCLTLEELSGQSREEHIARRLRGPGAALAFLPALRVDEAEAAGVRHGRPPGARVAGADLEPSTCPASEIAAESDVVRVLDPEGALIAVTARRSTAGADRYKLQWVAAP